MNRRDLFRVGGKAAVIVPLLGARQIVDLTKPAPKVLPPIHHGQILTPAYLNSITDAINELRAAK